MASFFGLHPIFKVSGDGMGGVRMSKHGRKEPRKILFLVSLSAIQSNDYILADRGYSTANGLAYIQEKGAYVTVRVNTAALPLQTLKGNSFELLKKVSSIKKPYSVGSWSALVDGKDSKSIRGRICVIRKSEEAIIMAHKKLKRAESKNGSKLQSKTLQYAKYIILFTTFPEINYPPEAVLEWYRFRWQIELVFKRFKSLAGLVHGFNLIVG